MGSLRYLHKYIEKSGALEKLKEMGLEDGSTVRIKDFEFEYFED
jgi:GTP-binding protein